MLGLRRSAPIRILDPLTLDLEAVNNAIHRAETAIAPTDDFHLEDMRKQRLRLLDDIARVLAAG